MTNSFTNNSTSHHFTFTFIIATHSLATTFFCIFTIFGHSVVLHKQHRSSWPPLTQSISLISQPSSHHCVSNYISRSVPVNNNYVVVPYTTSPNVYHHQQQQQQQGPAVVPVPQPALAAQPIVPDVPHYVHPTKTVIPSGPPQVFIQPPHHSHPYITHAPHQYQPHHLPSYPTVSYAPSHPGNGLSFGPGHGYNYYQPTLDFFGPYARHPSLLDSYVPSNLIYSKSRQHYNQFYAHPQVGLAPQQTHPHIEPDHSPIYNTIAYSTEQKPVVVPPPATSPLTKRESTVLRAAKPTALTKLENVKFVKKSNWRVLLASN